MDQNCPTTRQDTLSADNGEVHAERDEAKHSPLNAQNYSKVWQVTRQIR